MLCRKFLFFVVAIRLWSIASESEWACRPSADGRRYIADNTKNIFWRTGAVKATAKAPT